MSAEIKYDEPLWVSSSIEPERTRRHWRRIKTKTKKQPTKGAK